MTFSYNWLKDYIPKLLKPEKVADFLTMHSFEIIAVKKEKDDFLLDVDVLPNRAHDCLCHLGMAMELGAILKTSSLNYDTLKKEKLVLSKGANLKPINLRINCPSLVPRYSAVVVEGVKVSKSPQWLKKRLEVVGIRSINNIVDLTNFVMLETGQPLHAFDYNKIREGRMTLRLSREGEKVITLDDIERKLDEGVLVIEDEGRLIDLVGVMGGKLSEVDSKTKNIILQAGNFDRKSIYLASKKSGLSTAASSIYSQGIDPNLTIQSLERAYFLLKKLGGGKISQIIDIYPKKILPKRIRFNLNNVGRLLGLKIPIKEIKDILRRLNFKIKEIKSTKGIEVIIPTRRQDLSIPEDLIEEIGRVYGYEKIPAIFPLVSLAPPKRNFELFWGDITKDILKEAGFTEVYNYSFIGEKEAKILNCQERDLVELENPTSGEQKYLRPSLMPNLLKNIKMNFNYSGLSSGFSTKDGEFRIFELGKIFQNKKGNILEKRMLSGVIAEKEGRGTFYQLKGVIDMMLNKLGISNIWYDSYQATPEESKGAIWDFNQSAEVKVDNEEIGFLGIISSEVLKNLKIEGEIVLFDIDFEKLIKLCSEEHEYQPISQYPAAVRDLAVLVPQEVRVEEVLNKIEISGGSLVRDVDIFDIYEGEELPGGKKNLAFHIIYQAEDKTLSAKEIDEIQQRIIAALEEMPEWEVRK